jgi:hypothetical protein
MGRQNRQIAHLGEEMRRRWRGEESMGGGGDGWSSGEQMEEIERMKGKMAELVGVGD